MTGNDRLSKKDKVLGNTQKKKSYIVPAIVVVGLVLMAFAFFTNTNGGGVDNEANKGTFQVDAQNYAGQVIKMTDIEPEIKDGKVIVDLDNLKQNKIVRLEIPNQKVTLPNGSTFDFMPVTAFISDQGRVVGAISFCEPCSGTRFRIEGKDLVCEACGTRWTLQDLKGISGGCTAYPPNEVNYQVEGSKLIFNEQELRNWQPRP
jgi:uncharacterized membrane protein